MQITVSTRHGHLSPASQEKISEKVERLTRYHERLTAISVTVDLQHEEHPTVEIRATAERAVDFVAADSSASLMGSVDAVIHKLEQQLRKHKEKITNHRHPGRRAHDLESTAGDTEAGEGGDERILETGVHDDES